MKKVVCREDIQAEVAMFEQMRRDIISLADRVHRMQIDIDFIRANVQYKDVWIPTINTWDTTYGQSIADITSISDMRRIAIDAMHEAAIRDWMTEVPDITQWWWTNSNTN